VNAGAHLWIDAPLRSAQANRKTAFTGVRRQRWLTTPPLFSTV
jgi:hypothetical protein